MAPSRASEARSHRSEQHCVGRNVKAHHEAQRWTHHRRRAAQCGRVRAVGLAAPPDDRRGASGAC